MDNHVPRSILETLEIVSNEQGQHDIGKITNLNSLRGIENGSLHFITVPRDQEFIDHSLLNPEYLAQFPNGFIVDLIPNGDGEQPTQQIITDSDGTELAFHSGGSGDEQDRRLTAALLQLVNKPCHIKIGNETQVIVANKDLTLAEETRQPVINSHNISANNDDYILSSDSVEDGQFRVYQHSKSNQIHMQTNPPLPPLTPIRRLVRQRKPSIVSQQAPSDIQIFQVNEINLEDDIDNRQRPLTKKSLPHKKRISKKLKTIDRVEPSPPIRQTVIYQDIQPNQVADESEFLAQQRQHSHHQQHQHPPAQQQQQPQFACELCSEICSSQLEFFAHLKAHYEPERMVPKAEKNEEILVVNEPTANLENPPENQIIFNSFQHPAIDEVKVEQQSIPVLKESCSSQSRDSSVVQQREDLHIEEAEFSDTEDMLEGIRGVVDKVQESVENDSNDGNDWYRSGSSMTDNISYKTEENNQNLHSSVDFSMFFKNNLEKGGENQEKSSLSSSMEDCNDSLYQKKRRKHLSFEEKAAVIARIKNGENKKQILQEYQIAERTLRKMMQDANEIQKIAAKDEMKSKKSKKTTNFTILEDAVSAWFYQRKELGYCITGPLIQAKALEFCDKMKLNETIRDQFTASSGWLRNFKRRHNIRSMNANNGGSGDETLSVDFEGAVQFKKEIIRKIRHENISLENVYNADEAGLYWRRFSRGGGGDGDANDRVTALFSINASGTHKLKILVIGKSETRRDIKNLKTVSVNYSTTPTASMDRTIFLEWFKENFIPEVLEHQRRSRVPGKVLLLIDNAPSHPSLEILNRIHANFQVVCLPANATAIIQPLEQGIMALTQKIYRRNLLYHFYSDRDSDRSSRVTDPIERFTLKSCFDLLSHAWLSVTLATLQNVWKPMLGDFDDSTVAPGTSNAAEISNCRDVQVTVDEYIIDNLIDINAIQHVEQQKYKEEILNWLNENEKDCGWEPISDNELVAVLTREHNRRMSYPESTKTNPERSTSRPERLKGHLVSTQTSKKSSNDSENSALTNAQKCLRKALDWLKSQSEYSEEDVKAAKQLVDSIQEKVTN